MSHTIEQKILDDMMKQLFALNFNKCVKGYHLLNASPINETIWETINSEILENSDCKVQIMSNGSHSTGKDITCDLGGLSNKSAKYDKSKKNPKNKHPTPHKIKWRKRMKQYKKLLVRTLTA